MVVHGIVKIGDLISENGRFLESGKVLQSRLSPIHFFKLMGVVNSIPNDWELIIKQSKQHVCPPTNDTIQINIGSAAVDVLKATSKILYNEFKRKKPNGPFCSKQNKTKVSRSFSGVERNLLSSIYRHT